MSNFQAPSAPGGDSLDYKALNGSLLFINATEYVEGITTTFGVTDAVRVTVTALDGPQSGETFEDALVFPRVLRSQLKSAVGGKAVLGRLAQGTAKPGQSAPWILNAPNDDDVAKATRFSMHQASQQMEPVGADAPAGAEYGDVVNARPKNPWE